MNVESSGRILVIGDEPFIRSIIRDSLEDFGFEVIEAENGRIGIDRFESAKPDLVILDLRMPVMGGLEVLEILRQRSPDTPLIVVSSTGNIPFVVEALHLGAWDYILKPFQDMNVLLHSVKKCFRQSQLKRENKEYQELLEDLVREKTRGLTASEQLYRTLFEHTGTATAIVENDMNLSMVNSEFELLSGFKRHEIIGKKQLMDFVAPGDLKKMMFYHERRRSKDFKDMPPEQYEFVFITTEGQERSIMMRVGLIPGTDRSIISLLDITDRKKAEQRWQRIESQLRKSQKMEAIGTLAGGIAHDLNNILSPVLGYANMIMDSSKPGGVTFHRSEKIQKAALRAADLVNQILSFSRRREEEIRPVKIHPVAREVLRLLRGSIPSTIRIIDRIDKSCGPIKADPTQIYQVLMNLCTNAYHAMDDTGGELVVSLGEKTIAAKDQMIHPGLVVPGRYLCLEVKDTGCGIPGEFIEKIFDPYYTTKEEGKGTGLGLSTVYGIVKTYHGEIMVSSVPGKGSCFSVFFPVVEVAPMVAPPEVVDRFECSTQTISKLMIMVVDDDRDIADMCREGLETLGYEVVVRYSGVDALNYFKQNPGRVNLMVTDQTMPHMTGIDLRRKLMVMEPDLPVILCSGYSGDFNKKKEEGAGIRRFLMKPFTIWELSKTIQEVLRC